MHNDTFAPPENLKQIAYCLRSRPVATMVMTTDGVGKG